MAALGTDAMAYNRALVWSASDELDIDMPRYSARRLAQPSQRLQQLLVADSRYTRLKTRSLSYCCLTKLGSTLRLANPNHAPEYQRRTLHRRYSHSGV